MQAQRRGNFMLLATAMIWGVAFVAQRAGMDHVGPFTFNGARSMLGAMALLPCIALLDRKNPLPPQTRRESGPLLPGGFVCGAVLFIASSLQQTGLQSTTAGKAGFITALYIVLVPLMGMVLGKKVSPKIWAGVALALCGMYLLCVRDGFTLARGDWFVLLSALFFALHIWVIAHYSPRVDGVRMSCLQFMVCGGLSLACAMVWEKPSIAALAACWIPLAYAGVLSCGVAYTLQILAQRDTSPAVASLILSLEAVFAALAGWLLRGEAMTLREGLGAALVFAATLLAQLR